MSSARTFKMIAGGVKPSIAVSLLAGVSLWMWYPLFGKYLASDLNFSGEELGITFGAFNLSLALMSLPSGKLSDSLGRRPTTMLGAFMLASASAIMTFGKTLETLSAAAFMAGAGFSFFVVSLSAYAIDHGGIRSTGAIYGLIFTARLAGEVVGSFIGGAVKEFYGAPTLFTLSAILALTTIPPAALMSDPVKRARRSSPVKLVEFLRSEKKFRLLASGLIFHTLGFSMILPFLSVHAHEIGLSDYGIGLVNMAWTVAITITAMFWGLMADRIGGRRILTLHLTTSIASWLFYAYSYSFPSIITAAIIFGVVGAMDLPSRRKMLAGIDQGKGAAGTLVGALDFLTGLSMIPGPLISGALYSHFGSLFPFWAGAFANALGLVFLARLRD